MKSKLVNEGVNLPVLCLTDYVFEKFSISTISGFVVFRREKLDWHWQK